MPRRDDDARALRGRAISPNAPAPNDVLTWNGSIWTPQASAPAAGVLAAPKYLVGNVPNGDTIGNYASNGFYYFSDPGDGSGINAAINAANNSPGDVHIRPGNYNLSLGGVAVPWTVPAGCVVSGAGDSTVILARNAGDQGVFVLGADAVLRDVKIVAPAAGANGTGSTAIVKVTGGGAHLDGVYFDLTTSDFSTLRYAVLVDTPQPNTAAAVYLEDVHVEGHSSSTLGSGTLTSGVRITRGNVVAQDLVVQFCEVACEVLFDRLSDNAKLSIDGFRFTYFMQYGLFVGVPSVDASSTSNVRLHDGVFQGDFDVAPQGPGTKAGVLAQVGSVLVTGSSFSDCNKALDADVPVGFMPTNVSAHLRDCQIKSCGTAVRLGNRSRGSIVEGCEITQVTNAVLLDGTVDPSNPPEATTIASNYIKLENVNDSKAIYARVVKELFVRGNKIVHQFGNAYATIDVARNGGDNNFTVVVSDNDVQAVACKNAIYLDAYLASVTGNRLFLLNNPNLFNGGESVVTIVVDETTFTGNVIDATICQGLTAAVWVRGSYCTVSGNTANVSNATGVTPAIVVAGDRNVCSNNSLQLNQASTAIELQNGADNNVVIGNICRTTPAVSDSGAGNEVAHNI